MLDDRESAAAAPTRYAQVGPDRIAYRSIGNGAPLLLLTRMRGTLDTWDPPFLDELAKSHRVITVDYPGVGYSSGTLPPGIGLAADFVAAFADALELGTFVLLGWSWGGTVAQTFVVEHPGRATHAILVGTNPPGELVKPIQPAFIERAFRPVENWFALNGGIPNAHLVVYPETGHGPQHQYPELAARQIEDFLRYAVR